MHRSQHPRPLTAPTRGQAILSEQRRLAERTPQEPWPQALSLKVQTIVLFIYGIFTYLNSISERPNSQADKKRQSNLVPRGPICRHL